jgi:hypothetical protein
MPIAYPYKFSDWYGYDKDCVGKVPFSASIDNNSSSVCSASVNQTYYHNGSSTPGAPINNPVVSNIVYSDIQGQNKLSSGNYGILYSKYIVVNGVGVVTAITNCVAGPFSGSAGQMGIKFICTQTMATDYWHDGSGTLPAVGDTVYTNSAGTTAQTNRFVRAGLGYYTFSNLNGVVTGLALC